MISTEEALASLDAMADLPSPENYICILQKCRKEKNLVHAKTVHVHMCNYGMEKGLDNHLVPLFVDCGGISHAQQVFNQTGHRTEHAWNSLIQGYVKCGRSQHALDIYQKMQAECVTLNKYTFVALLKACARLKNGEKGIQLRSELAVKVFERDPFVGSTLVYMYAKCGLIEEAREVFDELPVRDVVSWNALITGYAEHGLGQEALHFLEQMQLQGVCPNSVTYICSLKICSSLGSISRAKQIHTEIVQKGMDTDLFASNTLVAMYAKCGLLEEAREMFKELPLQDIISWTALITGCADHGHGEQALLYLEQMQSRGFSPDGVTLACSLKACGNIAAIDRGQKIHAEIVKKGLDKDLFIGNTLADMYVKCRSVAEAQEVFDMLSGRDVVSWNTLITGYVEEGPGEKVLDCLDQMQADGVSPDDVTFISCLKICGSLRAIGRGQEIHSEIVMRGFEKDHFLASILVDMHAKCGLLAESQEVFDKLSTQGVVSWNSLIAGYAEKGYDEEALECLEQMQLDKISPDAITFVFSLKTCGTVGAKDKGQYLHAEIVKRGLESETFISNTLVDMYAKCGSLAEAQKVFDNLATRSVISWNAVIAGCAEHDFGENIPDCLEQMQFEGLSPDAVTFVLILKGCGNIGAIDRGREVHGHIIKKGFERDALISSTLVGMYAECNSLGESESSFDELSIRDVVSWTTLITGYAELGLGEKLLTCLEQMKLESISPDAITLVYVLKACGNTGAIGMGQEIHADIAKRGLEGEPYVCSNLVDMYAKCGLVIEAREIFDKMPVQDAVSWTALIAGYAEEGLWEEVLSCLEQMQLEGVPLDAVTMFCSLKACRSLVAIDKGREMHIEVAKKGLDLVPVVGNSLVDMYAQCGTLVEVQVVFDELPVQDVVSWNILITAYAEYGFSEEALNQLKEMQVKDVTPNAVTYVCSLKACGNVGAKDRGEEMHMEIVKKGFERDSVVSSILVDMYAKCGLLLESSKVFGELPAQDVVSWTALIAGYAEHGYGEETLRCLEQMCIEGLSPNAHTFVCILKCCGITSDIDRGREIHAEITKKGFELDNILGNSLVDMYAKCGLFAEVQNVFDQLPIRDVISWTAVIAGYAEHGNGVEALNCFNQMQQEGMSPNAITFSCSLKACGSIGDLYRGQEIHAEIVERGYERDLVVGNTLVLMYCKCGLLAEAMEVFDNLPVRDIVSWSVLISGHADHGLANKALECFQWMQLEGMSADIVLWNALVLIYAEHGESENAFVSYMQMQQQGLLPDSMIFMSILKACGNAAVLEPGKRIHAQILVATDLEASQEFLATALIDMYGKCGSMADAQQVFDTMPLRVLVTWNALITSYARQGEGEPVLYLLEKMIQEGVESDEVTFLSILTVCSHGGLVDKGQNYFKAMSRDYGISPTVKHHTCIIDLLGRAGQLEEALAMVKKMPFLPDLLAWNSVLGACQKWDDVRLGRQAFEFTGGLDEKNAATFILMSNIFAAHT